LIAERESWGGVRREGGGVKRGGPLLTLTFLGLSLAGSLNYSQDIESIIIDSGLLPEPITSYIHSDRVEVFWEKGKVILAPASQKPDIRKIFGRYTDGKLSSEEFIREKHAVDASPRKI
jgi:hypothetical protein